MAVRDLEILAPFRARQEWQLCPGTNDTFWLRVPWADEEEFRNLPLLGRWHCGATGLLTRLGHKVPELALPERGWLKLNECLTVGVPTRGAVGMLPVAVSFALESSSEDILPTALLCHWDDFRAWADHALAPRIECLRFAKCEDDRTFVMGAPLPPVRGKGFHRSGRLWIPCGFVLPGHVWPELLEERIALGGSRLALMHPDGSHEIFAEEHFVSASRATIRQSQLGFSFDS